MINVLIIVGDWRTRQKRLSWRSAETHSLTMDTNSSEVNSWVEIPAHSDFSIHNIPFGVFRAEVPRVATAIGEYVIDLHVLHQHGYFVGMNLPPGVFDRPALNDFFALGRKTVSDVRLRLIGLLDSTNPELRDNDVVKEKSIHRQSDVEMLLPVQIPNYTDFYSSEEHATNVGSMFRDPKNALLPNWKHLPVGYHGRASSIVVSGTNLHRPKGQIKPPDKETPEFSPSKKLDFELEVAFITCSNTRLGESISAADAENHIVGFVLFNDWSARDIQQWEYVPLGPFLGKNFGSTVSAWVVTLDALEPFRTQGPPQEPRVLPYLQTDGARNFDIHLEVLIQPENGEPALMCRSNYKYLYWSMSQQLAHHTVNGCNIQVGDMYASGTISGPSPGSYGSLLELSWNGKKPLSLADGTVRTFLDDGDTVIMKGHAEKNGIRVGFGECRGKILPAL
jgi:fumarylacetoacetase